jgi:REP-associated tyrosine transposase
MDRKYFDPWAETLVTVNRLRHWHQTGATYFLTFRLADSIPTGVVARWSEERAAWLRQNPEPWSPEQEREYHVRFSSAFEHWLDDCHGDCLLRNPNIRTAVAKVLGKYNGDRYYHHAWVLMPNHAHVLTSLGGSVQLAKQLQAGKGASSSAAGLIIGRPMSDDGFWQKDYFDRLIRDGRHFWNCARYVRRNPAKAKLRDDEYTLYLSEEVRAAWEQDG